MCVINFYLYIIPSINFCLCNEKFSENYRKLLLNGDILENRYLLLSANMPFVSSRQGQASLWRES